MDSRRVDYIHSVVSTCKSGDLINLKIVFNGCMDPEQSLLSLSDLNDCSVQFSFAQKQKVSGTLVCVEGLNIKVMVSTNNVYKPLPGSVQLKNAGSILPNSQVVGSLKFDPISWLYSYSPELFVKIHSGPESPGYKLLNLTKWNFLEIHINGTWKFQRRVDGRIIPNDVYQNFYTPIVLAVPKIEIDV